MIRAIGRQLPFRKLECTLFFVVEMEGFFDFREYADAVVADGKLQQVSFQSRPHNHQSSARMVFRIIYHLGEPVFTNPVDVFGNFVFPKSAVFTPELRFVEVGSDWK